jgi:hypothetical protein
VTSWKRSIRTVIDVWICAVLFGAAAFGAQQTSESAGEQFVGTWTGMWEGAGSSGGFELTLDRNKDGAVTGRVSVTGEPTYKAIFKTLSFDGKKMSARYDFPPDEAAEVVLGATFDGNTAKGTWSLREKAQDREAFAGTWSVEKK